MEHEVFLRLLKSIQNQKGQTEVSEIVDAYILDLILNRKEAELEELILEKIKFNGECEINFLMHYPSNSALYQTYSRSVGFTPEVFNNIKSLGRVTPAYSWKIGDYLLDDGSITTQNSLHGRKVAGVFLDCFHYIVTDSFGSESDNGAAAKKCEAWGGLLPNKFWSLYIKHHRHLLNLALQRSVNGLQAIKSNYAKIKGNFQTQIKDFFFETGDQFFCVKKLENPESRNFIAAETTIVSDPQFGMILLDDGRMMLPNRVPELKVKGIVFNHKNYIPLECLLYERQFKNYQNCREYCDAAGGKLISLAEAKFLKKRHSELADAFKWVSGPYGFYEVLPFYLVTSEYEEEEFYFLCADDDKLRKCNADSTVVQPLILKPI